MISYSFDDENSEIGYIKYSDVELIEGNNFLSSEYDSNKKYYVSSNDVHLYDGPGLLFENNDLVVLPKGELLDVKYYNQIDSRRWLYVTYEDYSGWVMQCRYNTVNDPYSSIVVDKCVDEVLTDEGILKINQENVFLYKDAKSNEKISAIVTGSEIAYDYKITEPGMVKFHVNYDGIDGFIIGVETIDGTCENLKNDLNDGKLYIIWQEDKSIKTCV